MTNAVALFPLRTVGNNTHLALDLTMQGTQNYEGGQHGIVSALAVGLSPMAIQSEAVESVQVLAVGTFSNSVGIYLIESQWLIDMLNKNVSSRSSKLGTQRVLSGEHICMCGWIIPEGQGITQVCAHTAFAP